MTSPRLKHAHNTMVQNVFKLIDADAWTLETTTAGQLGEKSIAEDTHAYAEQIARGKVEDPAPFYAHRYASDELPLETPKQARVALAEATGPATWSAASTWCWRSATRSAAAGLRRTLSPATLSST